MDRLQGQTSSVVGLRSDLLCRLEPTLGRRSVELANVFLESRRVRTFPWWRSLLVGFQNTAVVAVVPNLYHGSDIVTHLAEWIGRGGK